jgi:hypothetical protein
MTRGHGWSLTFTMWRTCTSCFLAGFYRRFLRAHQGFDLFDLVDTLLNRDGNLPSAGSEVGSPNQEN